MRVADRNLKVSFVSHAPSGGGTNAAAHLLALRYWCGRVMGDMQRRCVSKAVSPRRGEVGRATLLLSHTA